VHSRREGRLGRTPPHAIRESVDDGDWELLRVIAENAPRSLDELARLIDKPRSNLSRT